MLLFNGPADKASEFLAPPTVMSLEDPAQNESLRMVGGAKPNPQGDTEILFVDRVSESLGIAPHPPSPIDTTYLDTNSRHAVYEYVSELGNESEFHHKVGKEKLDLMQAGADLIRDKGRWWAKEAQQRKVLTVKLKVREIRESVRVRKHRAVKAAEKAAEDERLRMIEVRKQTDKAQMIMAALDSADKWNEQDAKTTAKVAAKKELMARLQMNPPDSDPPEVARQRGGKSHHLAEWSEDGLPRTAAAAAAEFGTAVYQEEDTRKENSAWHKEGKHREKVSRRRQDMRDNAIDGAKQQGWTQQCDEWRKQVQDIEDANNRRLERERLAHQRKLEERARLKLEANIKRAKLRKTAEEEAEAARKRANDAALRKVLELEREANERLMWGIEEARQCAIDPFWGLPTEWERLRRLEEERRRIWEARIGDRRTRMVQIGEAKSDTKDETEHIRNCRQGDYFGPVDTFGRLIDPHTGKPGAFPDENPMLRM